MLNGTSFTPRPIAGSEACGEETGASNELAEIDEFAESNRGQFGEEVLDSWIRREVMENFSKDGGCVDN